MTPAWVKDAVFYQIFPDRFAQSLRVPKPSGLEPWAAPPTTQGYKGGDLLGVLEHLDHLQDLGITALYFCPIFQSGSNHRYHTHDYFTVDPMLGGNAAFVALLAAAHKRGMKVILDGVFNHASRGFFQFHDILENGTNSAYLDWFHVKGFPLNAYSNTPNYDAWWGYPALPKFNTNTEHVREFLWGVAEHWVRLGIDGWRLDVPNEIDDDSFWQEFRNRVKAINPEAYIVGEIWGDATRWLRGDQFDAVMNYNLSRAILGFCGQNHLAKNVIADTGLKETQVLDAPGFANELERLHSLYPQEINLAQMNLLGSHDTPRVLSVLGKNDQALRLALLLQMTLPGAPCVYYGDELGMTGLNDPGCRGGVDWNSNTWDHQLLEYTKSLIALRHANPVLRHGTLRCVYSKESVVVLERKLEGTSALVVLNVGDQAQDVVLLEAQGVYRDALSNTEFVASPNGLALEALGAQSGCVLLRQ